MCGSKSDALMLRIGRLLSANQVQVLGDLGSSGTIDFQSGTLEYAVDSSGARPNVTDKA